MRWCFFIFFLCVVLGSSGADQSYVKNVDTALYYLVPQLQGNVLCVETWTYFFDTPHTHVFRSVPAGYSPNRDYNNDGIGNIIIFNNVSLPYPEAAPSLFSHEPHTFEVFEDVSAKHSDHAETRC